MLKKPTTIGEYVNQALVWSKTEEGHFYWRDFRQKSGDPSSVNTKELLEYLPQCNVWGRGVGSAESRVDTKIHAQLLIIAKYWERFGNLPSIELLKGLRNVG